jgi:hypothetical protein
MVMSKFSDEDRAMILAQARAALEDAEASLNAPRPEIAWPPPSEDAVQRAARLAGDRAAAQVAAERRDEMLTESEAQQLEARMVARLGTGLGEQKEFFTRLLAELVAELQAEFEQKVAELSAEIGALRAEATIAKAYGKSEVIDLPNPFSRKRVA